MQITTGIYLISKNNGNAFEIIANDYAEKLGFQKRTIGSKAVSLVDLSATQVYVELVKNKPPYEVAHNANDNGKYWVEKIDGVNVTTLQQIYDALAPLAY